MHRLLLFALLVLVPTTSFALDCVPADRTPAQRYADADAVFIGKIVAEENKLHTVEVGKVWKGVDKFSVTIRSDLSWGDRLPAGKEYLFFVAKGQEADFDLGVCSKSVFDMSDADEHLRYLNYHPLMGRVGIKTAIVLGIAAIGGGAWYFLRRARSKVSR